jgi:hypothetical protein
MKFLIIASLFVLSVVAEPEAEAQWQGPYMVPEAKAQHGLTHKTSGFVRYTNGAITPEDTESVKAAKIQHHTLKAATYAAINPFHQVYQPKVYGLHHQQQLVAPQVYGLHRQHQAFAPHVYGLHHQQQFVTPQVYGLHGNIYNMPAVRHLGKREAEAEPEAEAEAEAQFYGSQYYGQYYGTPARTYTTGAFRYPSAYYTTGYPVNTLTGYPKTYNTALTGYPSIYTTPYTGFPTTTYTGYPTTFNTALTGYPSIYTTPYTGYPTTTYTGYPTTHNGYPVYIYNNKAVKKQ